MTASHWSDIRPLLHLHNELPIKKKFAIEATIYKYTVYHYLITEQYMFKHVHIILILSGEHLKSYKDFFFLISCLDQI